MRKTLILTLFVLVVAFVGCAGGKASRGAAAEAPQARVVPKVLETHGHERIDNYYWLNERENPEVIDYLEAENSYLQTVMGHTDQFQHELFEEIKGRIKKDDSSVPYREGDFYYYTRYEKGKEYAFYCRKPGSLEAEEEILFDGNKLAEGQDYFGLRGPNVSSEQDIAAVGIDTVGRRIYTIRFKNLKTGEFLADEIPEVTGNMAWANDNKTLFYARQDLQTLRSYRIYRHVLGSDPAKDTLVYEEKDDTFGTYVWKTRSKKYLMIGSYQTLSSEMRFLDAKNPTGEFQVFLPRERDHEYSVDHLGDHFFVKTNWKAKNFRLMKTPIERRAKKDWKEVLPHRDDVLLEDFEVFDDFLTAAERKDGLVRVRVRPWKGGEEHYLDFGEPTYLAYISNNPNTDTTVLRYGYTSMTTPSSTFDYDMVKRTKTLLKQTEVLGDFDSANYVTERLEATAQDGVKVPISLVYRKGTKLDGTTPLLLYGYGSYGNSIDATFRGDRLSLLDRGFVYAIAHVRGGEEMGRWWYEDGKLLKKKNTFSDFVDCADHLIQEEYADPQRLFAAGGSAGGLLMGAVINMRPELFRGVIAGVPFVDVITTMLDDSIPLTTSEYDEWGNPNDQEYYDYILSYSPYDNVEPKAYPNMLVTTGLHDSQVQYWEPAKWVAKLRALKTDDNLLLLKTNMDAGHGGKSGRFRRYEQTALTYAFVLDLSGIDS